MGNSLFAPEPWRRRPQCCHRVSVACRVWSWSSVDRRTRNVSLFSPSSPGRSSRQRRTNSSNVGVPSVDVSAPTARLMQSIASVNCWDGSCIRSADRQGAPARASANKAATDSGAYTARVESLGHSNHYDRSTRARSPSTAINMIHEAYRYGVPVSTDGRDRNEG
jgi:hypothetical protein